MREFKTLSKVLLLMISVVAFASTGCSAKWGDPDGDNQPEITEVEIGNDEPIECTREDKQRGIC